MLINDSVALQQVNSLAITPDKKYVAAAGVCACVRVCVC